MIKNWKYVLAVVPAFTLTSAFAQSLKDGQRAAELERYREAINTLQSVNKTPSVDASLSLADAYLRAGVADSAAIYYTKSASIDPKSAVGMVAAGKAALVKGNTAEAEKQFEAAIKASKKKDPNIYMLIGQAYADAKVKDSTKGVAYLTEANKLTKNANADAYVILGDLYLSNPSGTGGGDAMNAYDQAIRIDKNNARAHFRRGRLYLQSRNYNEAQAALQAAIAADPSYAPALRELGEMYIVVGKYPEAVETYKKYMSISANDPDIKTKYSQFLFLSKDYKGAQTEAEAALAKNPNNAIASRVAALAYNENGETEKALTAMDNYFKNAKQETILASDYANYGKILAKAGKADLASENFDKALQMDPNNIELMDDMATFYVKQKQYAKAIPLYNKIIESKPASLNIYNYKLAEAYYNNKQLAEADVLYTAVLKANAAYAPGIFRRGQIADELDTDKSGDAKPFFEEFIKVVMADPAKQTTYKGYLIPANYLLGYYAFKAKDYTTAKAYWNEVLRIDATNKDAKSGINNIDQTLKGGKK